MAQLHKIHTEAQIKSPPQKIFDIYHAKSYLMPKISPHKLQSIQVLQGDGKALGSVRLWTYVMGVPVIAKDKVVAVDEENMSVTFEIIGGEVTKYYKDYRVTFLANSKNGINIVKWTIEYEKANEDVADPYSQLEFLVGMSKEIDAYLDLKS